MKVGKLILLTASACTAMHTRWQKLEGYSFTDYEREFSRHYDSTEERLERKALVDQRLVEIVKHNADPSKSWKRGVNQFTDRTEIELAGMNGYDRAVGSAQRYASSAAATEEIDIIDLGLHVDWREKGVVTPVKNQGECGSCWSFATAETIESHWALKTGEMQELSEQFILDCVPNTNHCGGNGGCEGGTAKLVYDKLKELGGIPSEWTYPYISGTGAAGTCHGVPLDPEHAHSGQVMKAANVTGMVAVTSNSYKAVLSALATQGPLTITVDASEWHDYEGGVFTSTRNETTLNHLVQLVGFGQSDQGEDYWLVRNSWTPLWGEDGYIKLFRYGENAPCYIDPVPADGDGCDGGPPTVTACGTSGVLYDAAYPIVV